VCGVNPTRQIVVATPPRMTCSPIGSCSLRPLQVRQALHLARTPESFVAHRLCPAALAHQPELKQLSRRQHRNQTLRRNCHTNFHCSFKGRQLLVHRPALPVTLLVCWLRQTCHLSLPTPLQQDLLLHAEHSIDRGIASLDFGPNSRTGFWGRTP